MIHFFWTKEKNVAEDRPHKLRLVSYTSLPLQVETGYGTLTEKDRPNLISKTTSTDKLQVYKSNQRTKRTTADRKNITTTAAARGRFNLLPDAFADVVDDEDEC